MKKKKKNSPQEIHIVNGPNLNMMGFIDSDLFGLETLTELQERLKEVAKAAEKKVKLHFFQTNYEGEMIEYLQSLVLSQAEEGSLAGVIINPNTWAHTSISLRDTVAMLRPVPTVEVHLANLLELEEFRHYSFLEEVVDYRVLGMGQEGYVDALRWIFTEMKKERLDVH